MPNTRDGLWLLVTAAGFAVFLYPDRVVQLIATIPESVIYGGVGVTLVIAALNLAVDWPGTPLPMLVSGGSYVVVVAPEIYGLAGWPTFGGLGFVPAVVVAVALWFLSLIVVYGIVQSIRGVDSDDLERERRARIDDPYGDKHAAQILENESDNGP